jgi:hypothetical protein
MRDRLLEERPMTTIAGELQILQRPGSSQLKGQSPLLEIPLALPASARVSFRCQRPLNHANTC